MVFGSPLPGRAEGGSRGLRRLEERLPIHLGCSRRMRIRHHQLTSRSTHRQPAVGFPTTPPCPTQTKPHCRSSGRCYSDRPCNRQGRGIITPPEHLVLPRAETRVHPEVSSKERSQLRAEGAAADIYPAQMPSPRAPPFVPHPAVTLGDLAGMRQILHKREISRATHPPGADPTPRLTKGLYSPNTSHPLQPRPRELRSGHHP